jgi:hypothetical protein
MLSIILFAVYVFSIQLCILFSPMRCSCIKLLKSFSFDSNTDEVEDEEKELEHSSLQEKLDWELKELDRKLEQKEVKAAQLFFV